MTIEKPIPNWRRGLQLPRNWADTGTNHTKRKTLAVLKALKRRHDHNFYPVTDAETYDSGTQKSKDLYGFIDILVAHDRAIQACGNDWQPHIDKLRYDVCPLKLQWWLEGDLRSLELWGWRKLALPGKRTKEWWPRIQLITMEFLSGVEAPTMLSFEAMLNGKNGPLDKSKRAA